MTLCDDLELWDEGVMGKAQEGMDMYVHLLLIHVVWQKQTQHCKATILQ